MRNSIIRQGKIIDIKTNKIIYDGSTEDENIKNYAALVRCGHAGVGYYIPIIFSIDAKDVETAGLFVRTKPRVKHDRDNAILNIVEISNIENHMIELINKYDPYLTSSTNKETMQDIIDRRIVEASVVDNHNRISKYILEGYEDIDDVYQDIRVASDYDESLVLQRELAPIKNGHKYVFKNYFDFKELLKKYYAESVKRIYALNSKSTIPALYYQIMGEENDLGIVKDGRLLRIPGFEKPYRLSDEQLMYIEESLKTKSRYSPKKKSVPMEPEITAGLTDLESDELPHYFDPKVKRVSQTERFYNRYPKVKRIENITDVVVGVAHDESQPGSSD